MNEQWNSSTSQMFSYYPKYEYLDNVISLSGRRRVNLYIDVKGCGQALFQEWAVKQILFQSQGSRSIDTSLFSAIMDFIGFHKMYAKKRQIDLHMYMFMETGKSKYHLDVYDGYKSNRQSGDFFGLDMEKKDFYFTILSKNYIVAEKVANKIPGVSFIRLDRMEADFVPWYLMKHALPKEDVESAVNIVYSTDKDMLQCLDASNIYQFYKHYKSVKMISQDDIYTHWLKKDLETEDQGLWFPLVLSIIGDDGDGFKGVTGVGPVALQKTFGYVKTMCGNSMDKVYDNISKGLSIFSKSYATSNKALNKIIAAEDIIIRNLKLASYKLLSDYVNGDYPTEVFAKKKKITDTVHNTNKCNQAGVLHNALAKAGQSDIISEATLLNLFGDI